MKNIFYFTIFLIYLNLYTSEICTENSCTLPGTSGKTAFIITGDENRNKTMCLPGGGFVSIKIELPENRDKLVTGIGYQPLHKFYLTK